MAMRIAFQLVLLQDSKLRPELRSFSLRLRERAEEPSAIGH